MYTVLVCLDAGNSWMTSPCEAGSCHCHLVPRGLPVGSVDVPVIYCCVPDPPKRQQLLKWHQSFQHFSQFVCVSGTWGAFGWMVWAQGFLWGSNQMVTRAGIVSVWSSSGLVRSSSLPFSWPPLSFSSSFPLVLCTLRACPSGLSTWASLGFLTAWRPQGS